MKANNLLVDIPPPQEEYSYAHSESKQFVIRHCTKANSSLLDTVQKQTVRY